MTRPTNSPLGFLRPAAIMLLATLPAWTTTVTLNATAGTGTSNQWTAGGASVGDDCSAYGSTSSTGADAETLSVPLEDASKAGTISSVSLQVAARVNQALGGNGIELLVRTNNAWYSQSVVHALTSSLAYYERTWTANPNTGAAWTWTEVNALQAGCRAWKYQGSPVFTVDHVKIVVTYLPPPVLTGPAAAANAGGSQTDSTYAQIQYQVSDEDDAVDTARVSYQLSGTSTWTSLTNTSGDTGAVEANSPTVTRVITWNARTQLGTDIDSLYTIRIIATDASAQKDTVATTALRIDTRKPTGMATFAITDSNISSAALQWQAAAETHFHHYEVWYGTNRTSVQSRTGSAFEWDQVDDADLAQKATTTTTIEGLAYLTKYYFKIWAIDSSGNELAGTEDSATTLTSPNPLVTGWDPEMQVSATQVNTDTALIGYEVWDTDDTLVTVSMELKLSGGGWDSTWTYMKSRVRGDTGSVRPDQTENDTIYWGVRAHLGPVDTTAFVRVIAADASGNRDTTASLEFAIDTKKPVMSGSLSSTGKTSSSVSLQWSAVSDENFGHYEIWYGTSAANVRARSNAAEWDDAPNDPNLATMTTTSTVITGLLANTAYNFKLWAVDDLGNEDTLGLISVTTDASTTVQITNIDDNMIDNANVNFNYGGSSVKGGASAGKAGTGGALPVRTLLRVNSLTAIPTGATIQSALLYCYCGTVGSATSAYNIAAYRVLRTWNEGTANGSDQTNMSNWTDYANEQPWTTAGCASAGNDREATAIATASVTDVGWYSWDITQTVSDWKTGAYANQGIIFISASEGTNNSYKYFHSAEGANIPYLAVQYTLEPPTVTGPGDTTLVVASQGEADSASIRYRVTDPNNDSVYVVLQYKPSGGAWASVTNATGGIDDSIHADGSTVSVRWSVLSQLGSGIDGTYYVRVIARDPTGLNDTTESSAFGVDTKAPQGLADFSASDSSSFWIQCSWTCVSVEGHFSSYEIWYGPSKTGVQNRDTLNASKWDRADHSGMATISTSVMKVSGLSASSKYYFKIWAVDSMGNEATLATVDSATTLDAPVPTVLGWDGSGSVTAAQIDTARVRIGVEIVDTDDDSARIVKVQYYKASGGTWTNATASGDTGWQTTGLGNRDTIYWDAKAVLPAATNEDYKVRVAAVDDTGYTDTTESGTFSIDFVAPSGLSALEVQNATGTSAGLSWVAATTESHFSHYEIWFGADSNDVKAQSGTAIEWDNDNDAALATLSTDTTTIDALTPATLYYFKIWAVDSAGNRATTQWDSIRTQTTDDPVVTGLDDAPYVYALQFSPDSVRIGYEVDDANDAQVTVTAQYRVHNTSTWRTVATAYGRIGTVDTSATANDTIIWNAATDLAADGVPLDSVFRVRVIAFDGAAYDTTISDTFAIDVQAPQNLAGFQASDTQGTQITFTWTAATDRNFNHYEIWYGTDSTQTADRQAPAAEWDNSDHAALATKTTTTTTVTGLTVATQYYWLIWAIDNIGNETALTAVKCSTKAMVTPQWSRTSLGAIMGGAIGEDVIYIGAGPGQDKLLCVNAATGATKWSFSTQPYSTNGCNMPTTTYHNGKYLVLASSGNHVVGRQDDGVSSSQIFPPVNLGAAAGTPYVGVDNASFFVPYTGNLTKRSMTDGSEIWTSAVANISIEADIAVFCDYVFVATTDGKVHKGDTYDFTPLSTFDAGAGITLPLWVEEGEMFVTPDDAVIYKVDAATMNIVWQEPLGAPNTGPAFMAFTGIPGVPTNDLYLAAADTVYKMTDAGASGSITWKFAADDTVKSGPINYNNVVYFGSDGGRFYAVNDATGSIVNNWPYIGANGDSDEGPWLRIPSSGTSLVIFGTSGGDLRAFALE